MFTRSEDQEFNNIVNIYLRSRGISKAGLARQIGISRQHLNRLLKEEIDWKLKHALRIMKVLDFTPYSFYEELWKQEIAGYE